MVEERRFLQAQGLRFGMMMMRLVVETFQGVGREGGESGRVKWLFCSYMTKMKDG